MAHGMKKLIKLWKRARMSSFVTVGWWQLRCGRANGNHSQLQLIGLLDSRLVCFFLLNWDSEHGRHSPGLYWALEQVHCYNPGSYSGIKASTKQPQKVEQPWLSQQLFKFNNQILFWIYLQDLSIVTKLWSKHSLFAGYEHF